MAPDEERAVEEQVRRAKQRQLLREEQLEKALQKLDDRHQNERRALSQELLEVAVGRKDIRDQLWADWNSRQQRKLSAELVTANRCPGEHDEEEAASNLKYQEQEDGASSSTAGAALNGKEGPEKTDEEKQALLKELLPAKTELRVEVQHQLEVLDEKVLRKVFEHRIKVEDPREIRARQRTLTAKRSGLCRFWTRSELFELEGTAEDDIAYVDHAQLGAPILPEIYEEIRKLLDIEENPIFSKTLQEWNQKIQLCTLQYERLKTQVPSVKNEMYQLIGFFSVFQGVLLTAVSQSSLLYCHNKWSPITLSVLASVITTFGVIQKLNQINDLQRDIDTVGQAFMTAVQVERLLRKPSLKGIDFVGLNAHIERNGNRESKSSKTRHLARLSFVLLILLLVAFGVLFPISFWRILCEPGSPAPPAS